MEHYTEQQMIEYAEKWYQHGKVIAEADIGYVGYPKTKPALPQPLVMGRSEQLTAFAEWLEDNHSIKIHDMILQDYIRYGG